MRYSKQRELVLRTVEQLCDHPTAEEIFDKAAPECPGLSLGTVYRNLNSLVEAGRVRRVVSSSAMSGASTSAAVYCPSMCCTASASWSARFAPSMGATVRS